jgi:hypothetical protein
MDGRISLAESHVRHQLQCSPYNHWASLRRFLLPALEPADDPLIILQRTRRRIEATIRPDDRILPNAADGPPSAPGCPQRPETGVRAFCGPGAPH